MNRRTIIIIIFIFSLALILNITYILSIGLKSPLLKPINPDSILYYDIGLNISQGKLTTGKPFFVAPLYPYFLGLILSLSSESVLAVIIVQILLGSMIPIFIYLTTANLFNKTTGLISGVLCSLYIPLIIYNSQILPVTLEVFLFALSLFLITIKPLRRSTVIAGGLIAGLSALSRPNIALIPVFVIIALLIVRRTIGLKKALIYGALFTISVMVAISPATIHNLIVSGNFIPITTHGGVNFYIGNNEFATGAFHAPPGFPASPLEVVGNVSEEIAERETGKELTPQEVSDFYFKKGLDFIKTRPINALKLTLKKLMLAINHYELSLNINLYFYRFNSILRYLPLMTYGIILPLGLVGLILGVREDRMSIMLIVYFLAGFLTLIPFIINAKYRLIFTPPLLVAAGLTLYKLSDFIRNKRYLTTCIVVSILMGLFILSNITILGLKPGINFDKCHFMVARYLFDNGNYKMAKNEAKKALRFNPDHDMAWFIYGLCKIKENKLTDAETAFRNAIASNPKNYKARYNLGVLLMQRKRYDEAEEQLIQAVTIEPAYIQAKLTLADLYLKMVNVDKAEEILLGLESKQLKRPEIRYRLGTIRFSRGDINGAIEYLNMADDYPDAHRLLSRCYLALGEIKNAIIEFEKERSRYPDNPLLGELAKEIEEAQ